MDGHAFRVCMHSVCQVPLKLDELICLLHHRPCDWALLPYCAHVHRDVDAQTIYCAALFQGQAADEEKIVRAAH